MLFSLCPEAKWYRSCNLNFYRCFTSTCKSLTRYLLVLKHLLVYKKNGHSISTFAYKEKRTSKFATYIKKVVTMSLYSYACSVFMIAINNKLRN